MTLQNNPWRLDFPIFNKPMNGKPLVYLDSGASAQKPYAVIETMSSVMAEGYANVHRGLYTLSADLTKRYEAVRARVAAFIGAHDPQEIVFTRNATEGFNLLAQSWGRTHLRPGDEIILSVAEHHANMVPWQMVAAETGAQLRYLPLGADGTIDLAALPDLLNARTRLVSITHISNVLGCVNDVGAMVKTVRQFDPHIVTVVDGSQGVVHLPVDVQAIGCDFYVFTGHKIYGPTGVGVLYGRADRLNDLPPWQGGGDMIETVTLEGATYQPAPQRFEAGTPAIVEVIGLGAALDYLGKIGMDRITAHDAALSRVVQDRLCALPGITLHGPECRHAGIFTFSADWGHPSDIAMILDQCGVAVRTGHHCAMPLMQALGVNSTVRVSLGLYNDASDVETLIEALEKARGLLS